MKTGKTKNIFMICNPEDDISTAAELSNGFLIGTSKGELFKYSFSGDLKWKISAHEGEVHCVRSDPENKLIATLGNDNNFIIWSEKHILLEDNIRKKIVFSQKDIKFF